MKIRKKALSCLILAVLVIFAGTSMASAMSCPSGHFPLVPSQRGWDEFSVTVFVVPEILASPGCCSPILGFNEQYVKANLFLTLTGGKANNPVYNTYSGVAVADDGSSTNTFSNTFCIIADYCSGRLGDAILNILQTEVHSDIRWISVEEESGNVLEQLLVGGDGLDPAHPLYFQLKITIQVPSQ